MRKFTFALPANVMRSFALFCTAIYFCFAGFLYVWGCKIQCCAAKLDLYGSPLAAVYTTWVFLVARCLASPNGGMCWTRALIHYSTKCRSPTELPFFPLRLKRFSMQFLVLEVSILVQQRDRAKERDNDMLIIYSRYSNFLRNRFEKVIFRI